jgi:hypothetical protein
MQHEPAIDAEKVESFIHQLKNKQPDLELMYKGEEAYNLLKKEILNLKK